MTLAARIQAAAQALRRSYRIRRACWTWLTRPGDLSKFCLHPRASEIRVRYREEVEGRPGPIRTAALQDLLHASKPPAVLRLTGGLTPREQFLRAMALEIRSSRLILELVRESSPPPETIDCPAYYRVADELTNEQRQLASAQTAAFGRLIETKDERWREAFSQGYLATREWRAVAGADDILQDAARRLRCFLGAAVEAQREQRFHTCSRTQISASNPPVVWVQPHRSGLGARRIDPLHELLDRIASDPQSHAQIVSITLPNINLRALIGEAQELQARLLPLVNELGADRHGREQLAWMATFFSLLTQKISRELHARFLTELGDSYRRCPYRRRVKAASGQAKRDGDSWGASDPPRPDRARGPPFLRERAAPREPGQSRGPSRPAIGEGGDAQPFAVTHPELYAEESSSGPSGNLAVNHARRASVVNPDQDCRSHQRAEIRASGSLTPLSITTLESLRKGQQKPGACRRRFDSPGYGSRRRPFSRACPTHPA